MNVLPVCYNAFGMLYDFLWIIFVAHQQSQNITDVGELLKMVMEKLCSEGDPRLCNFRLSTSQMVCCLSITINYDMKSYSTVCLIRYHNFSQIISFVYMLCISYLEIDVLWCRIIVPEQSTWTDVIVQVLFYYFDVYVPLYYRFTKRQRFRYGSEVDVGLLNRYWLFTS